MTSACTSNVFFQVQEQVPLRRERVGTSSNVQRLEEESRQETL